MAWRPAKSLQVLKGQLDAQYPGWRFLGFIGDAAHRNVPSDHNPNSAGVVCALDIGPGGGLNIHALARNLAASPHPDLKYIISNREIFEWQNGFKPRRYTGKDPHDTHIHISVGRGPDGKSSPPYDNTNLWNLGGSMPASQDIIDETAVRLGYNGFLLRDPSRKEIDDWLKNRPTLEAFERALLASDERKTIEAAFRAGRGDSVTVLKPGRYEVK